MPKPTKNPGVIKYKSQIIQSDRASNSWAWIEFPYDLKKLYGIGNLVPALIYFDNIEYRGSITKMGGKYPMLLIKRDILAKLNKQKGDVVSIKVVLDDKPREVIVPKELKSLFKQHLIAKAIFDKLAYTHRKEYANWVSEGKKPETRESRALKTIEMVLSKNSQN